MMFAHMFSRFVTKIRLYSNFPQIASENFFPRNNYNKLKIKKARNLLNTTGLIKAFATAEGYDLQTLYEIFDKKLDYNISFPNENDVLCLQSKSNCNSTIFLFADGVSVFWDMKDNDIYKLLDDIISQNSYYPYESDLIEEECDSLDFLHHNKTTKFHEGKIYLQDQDLDTLELYTFSNSLAQSVKLSIWESYLNKYGHALEKIVKEMQNKSVISLSEEEVLKKSGELFKLRHNINLTADLLDPPDFYWDRETLETLYVRTCNHLNIPRRTKIMNEKLNHCFEIINVLRNYLNDKHHIRLEWMIIILIMVEVVLGLLGTYKSFITPTTSSIIPYPSLDHREIDSIENTRTNT